MIKFTTGNLLESSAVALVNTVNCEGYMGKGIAYQFKLRYPKNNVDYIKACKAEKLIIGKLHYFEEDGKLIINFPTKNKWRAKSKIEYIIAGLEELVKLIKKLNIQSIAIPPLGSGNGGLEWEKVKKEIVNMLEELSKDVEVIIFEPSRNYNTIAIKEPKLSLSALVLMELKMNMKKFNSMRLQKTAYIMNILLENNYFKFTRYKYGPYDNSIAIISKNIKEYQKFHNVKSTKEAYEILHKKLVSQSVEKKLMELNSFIVKATELTNGIESDKELECLATVLYLVEEQKTLKEDEIIKMFKAWSVDKANRFSVKDIEKAIELLVENELITENLIGYTI